VLYLDYGRQQMVFEKGDDFDRDFPVDRSGLQLWLQDEDQLEVLFVAPGTPADEAGFAAGDIVRSINGIETKHFAGIVSIRELLKAEEGTEYRLGVLRDGSAIDIDLTLRDLM
jgi:C-terminal processing protease CtpA/Prc